MPEPKQVDVKPEVEPTERGFDPRAHREEAAKRAMATQPDSGVSPEKYIIDTVTSQHFDRPVDIPPLSFGPTMPSRVLSPRRTHAFDPETRFQIPQMNRAIVRFLDEHFDADMGGMPLPALRQTGAPLPESIRPGPEAWRKANPRFRAGSALSEAVRSGDSAMVQRIIDVIKEGGAESLVYDPETRTFTAAKKALE